LAEYCCRRWVVAYGHAERTLAAIRLLETQTAELLYSLPWLDSEQANWLKEAAEARSRTMNAPAAGQQAHDSLDADR
jgi:hypothetical protein